MEAYSYSPLPEITPVRVGGLVGNICPPDDGRFVSGCMGFVRFDTGDRRFVGGCVGHVVAAGPRRFVGGCVGYSEPSADNAYSYPGASEELKREARMRWAEASRRAA